jgi:hypothetical protein
MKTIISLTLTAILAGISVQALAVPATCQSLGIQNNVTPSAGCQIGTVNNDNPLPGQVNADAMFGFTDWIFAEKGFDTDEHIDVGFTILGDGQSGSWSLDAGIWDIYSDVMLVIKGGSGNTIPPFYVGYLLEDGEAAGTYLSPFFNGLRRKDISHITVYVRGDGDTSVPEPTTLALIGLGLVGLAFFRRRRS